MDTELELLKHSLMKLRVDCERAEVILSNLLALKHPVDERFIVSHDDVIVSLETVVDLLESVCRLQDIK